MNDQSLPVVRAPQFDLVPFDQLKQMAAAIAESGLFGMKTAPQALALMLIAQAEGQHPATITQDYDIIQGKGSRKTNSVLARFQQAGGSVEWHALTDKVADATFTPPPRAGKPLRLQWTIEMAKTAKLTAKDNWTGYARAMLRARCIAEGVRCVYPAAIGGMLVSEEAQDLPLVEKDVTSQGSHTTQPAEPSKPEYGDEAFGKNMPKWAKLIAEGKRTPDEIIATVESKATLTAKQAEEIRCCDVVPASEEDVTAFVAEAAEKSISIDDITKHLGVETIEGLTGGQLRRARLFVADPVGAAK